MVRGKLKTVKKVFRKHVKHRKEKDTRRINVRAGIAINKRPAIQTSELSYILYKFM